MNDSNRAMMAALAKYRDDIAGTITTGGSSTAYTVTTNQVTTALTNGFMVAFLPHTTSGAAPTLNVDSTGAKPLRGATGVALDTGSLISGTPYVAVYKSSSEEWLLHGYFSQPSTVPIGGLLPFVGSSAPNSLFVLPYGQAISRTTYASLFALTSTTFGVGDGSTTFNLPDLRGRSVFGLDNMGGTSANRLTNQSGGVDGDTRGATGGSETHTLTSGESASHTHSFSATTSTNGAHTHTFATFTSGTGGVRPLTGLGTSGNTITVQSDGDHTHTVSGTTGSSGSGTAHNNLPPAIILPYIMRVI